MYHWRNDFITMRYVMEKKQILAIVNEICKNTLMETLKIEYVDVGENFYKLECQ